MNRVSLEFLSSHATLFLCLAPAALALAVWMYFRTAAPLSVPARSVLRGLRALAFLIVLFALAEPVLTLVLPEAGKPGIGILVDRSASMSFPSGSGDSRATVAARLAGDLAKNLDAKFRVEAFGFGDGLAPLPLPVPDRGDSGSTAMGDAMEALSGRQGGRPLAGIFLIGDGANTAGQDPVAAARNLGVPVFAVPVGTDAALADAGVIQVRANPTAFENEPTAVEVEIAAAGLADVPVEVRIEDAGTVLGSVPVRLGAGQGIEQSVRLDVRPKGTGLRRWEVKLAGPEDAIGENNARSVAVRVLERKTQVLVLSGRLDWDHAFMKRTLAADSTFSYRFLVADRQGRWLPARAGRPAPAGPGDLGTYAAVVLGELPPSVGGALYADLATFVERGGGLLVLGGESGLARFRGTALARVLPAEVAPGPVVGRPVPVRLGPAGATHPVTMLADAPARSQAVWSSLPPAWPSPDRLRVSPQASVLLSFELGGVDAPALVAGFSGDGKVLLFGVQGFWRWRLLPRAHAASAESGVGAASGLGEDAYASFVLRMLRWVAEPAQRDRIRVEPIRGVFQNGESPEFTARVWDASYAPVAGARVTVDVFAAGAEAPSAPQEPLRRVELRPGQGEGSYAGFTEPLAPGGYRYRAEARDAQGTSLGRVESNFWVDRNGPEYVRLMPDRGTLEQIARAGGGQVVESASLGEWVQRLPGVIRRAGRIREVELWNHLALFGSFVIVLSVEWFLRRRRGLA